MQSQGCAEWSHQMGYQQQSVNDVSVNGVRLASLAQRRVATAPPRHPTYLLGRFSQLLELTSTRASVDNLLL